MIARLRELLAKQNRLQRSTRFKIIASIVLSIGAIAGFVTYAIAATAPSGPSLAEVIREQTPRQTQADEAATVVPGRSPDAIEGILDRVDRLREAREDQLNVALGALVVLAIALVVVWLGLALTYAELLLAAWLLAFPLSAIGLSSDMSRLLMGVVALAGAFTALIEGVRVLFGMMPGSVFAIARNTVVEAVRMKVSIIFIILLIFAMAAMPGLLNDSSPLRYRVQAFLQYGTGGAFWIIAILALFFSAASVAFEQRDRQIWQTMTKPVASWQYILGKWVGVAGVTLTLLLVSTSGIFLFTEYLRTQPAVGEEARRAAGVLVPSPDREILETQVLVARTGVAPTVPAQLSSRGEQFNQALADYIADRRLQQPDFARSPAQRRQVADDLAEHAFQAWRSIEPGRTEAFVFEGLEQAAQTQSPVILRYRIDSGANAPDQTYSLTFRIQGQPFFTRATGLGHMSTVTLAPLIVLPHAEHWHAVLMDDPRFYEIIAQGFPDQARLLEVEDVIQDGRLVVEITNADVETGRLNPGTITLPRNHLELTYAVGSYRVNFLRAAVVLWFKLGLLSMLAIVCASFLSFPVACLVAFGTFLAAESAGFLSASLPYYDAVNRDGEIIFYKAVIRAISLGVTGMFQIYADLRPTSRLIDGQLIPWLRVAIAAGVLGAWSLVLYGIGVLLFRRRELAIYSGH